MVVQTMILCFLYGGYSNKIDLIHTYDTKINSWYVPKTIGDNIIDKNMLTSIDYNRKIYLFDGYNVSESVNDMLILDTINLT